MFEANDAIIDVTLFVQATRLLARGPVTADGLLNLSFFLDALAFHDTLHLLPATTMPDASVADIQAHLRDRGLVRVIDTVPFSDAVSRDISVFLEARGGSDARVADAGAHGTMGPQSLLSGVQAYLLRGGTLEAAPERRTAEIAHFLERPRSVWPDIGEFVPSGASATSALGEEILSLIGRTSSGSVQNGVSYLRTFIYWRLSEHARIPLYPCSFRVPQIESIVECLRSSVAERVYQVVASAFAVDVREVSEDDAAYGVSISLTLALFLDHYRRSKDVLHALDDFRAEFEPVRRAFKRIEVALASATSLGERRKLRRELAAAMAALDRAGKHEADSSLEAALDLGEEAVKVLANPRDLTAYSGNLILRPLEWIKRWWTRRPLRPVFALRRRLDSIRGYESLVAETLGVPVPEPDFFERYQAYLDLFDPAGTAGERLRLRRDSTTATRTSPGE